MFKKMMLLVMIMVMVMAIPSSVYAEDGRGHYENTTKGMKLKHERDILCLKFQMEEFIYDEIGASALETDVQWISDTKTYYASVVFSNDKDKVRISYEVSEDGDELWVAIEINGRMAAYQFAGADDMTYTRHGEKFKNLIESW